MLETPNFVHTLGGSIQAFLKKKIWFDFNLYLYLMVWLEIGHLHISANTCDRELKLGTHLGGINSKICWEIFFGFTLNLYLYLMVWLEIGHLHTVEPYPHSGLYLFIFNVFYEFLISDIITHLLFLKTKRYWIVPEKIKHNKPQCRYGSTVCKCPISSQTIKYRYKFKSNQKKYSPKMFVWTPQGVCQIWSL